MPRRASGGARGADAAVQAVARAVGCDAHGAPLRADVALSAPRHRLVRGALAVGALAWLGAPAWNEQIDDQLITLAFAHEWAATGLIRWNTGEIVEACSSFLQLSLATGWIALGGSDANLFVKGLAVAAGLAMVLYANARLPTSFAGGLLLAALVTWEPTARWSFVGMETTLHALLVTVGWGGTFGAPPGRRAGLGLLWLAATAHPEGNLHFALAALIALRDGGSGRRAALAFGATLAVYHGLRTWTFGALLPTPYLVKVSANPLFGDQWRQLGWDLVTLGAVGAVLLVGFRPRAVALLPIGVQVLLTIRAEPDWMGHARHLLPGVWASAVAWAAFAPPRPAGPRAGWARAGLVIAVLAALPWEPPTPPIETPTPRDPRFLAWPGRWFGGTFDTTQLEDVVRIVSDTPTGGAVVIEDVGMPGNVPGVRIIDLVGLTDRAIARANLGDADADRALIDRFAGGPGRPVLVRLMKYADSGPPRPLPWLRLGRGETVSYPQGTAVWYRISNERPTDAEIAARWRALHARYPSQGPLAWHLARTEAEQGRLVAAGEVAADMLARFPRDPLAGAVASVVFAPAELEDYDEERAPLRRVSRPLPREDAPYLTLVVGVEPRVDAGQLVRVAWGCGGPEQVVVTQGTTRVPLPGWACAADTATLRVEALDGRPARPLPESLYVGLVSGER